MLTLFWASLNMMVNIESVYKSWSKSDEVIKEALPVNVEMFVAKMG